MGQYVRRQTEAITWIEAVNQQMSDHASNLGAAVNVQTFGKAGANPELEQSQSFRASPCACIKEYYVLTKRLSMRLSIQT